MSNVEGSMSNVKCQMSIRLNFLSERPSGVSPVIFPILIAVLLNFDPIIRFHGGPDLNIRFGMEADDDIDDNMFGKEDDGEIMVFLLQYQNQPISVLL